MTDKKVNSRKRFIITDTTGLLVTVAMLSAYLTTPIRHVFADQGFAGRLVDWIRSTLRIRLEIVRKPADQRGFSVITRWWVVGGGKDAGVADRLPPSDP
ncbi:hypothetical protein [Nonomuraea sp. NPDC023979]|uniref:hypothetical protein n=1 Tax=Nonomuraea sp. NPDC023979 TaxID=3154796 RepID=UPI003406FF96